MMTQFVLVVRPHPLHALDIRFETAAQILLDRQPELVCQFRRGNNQVLATRDIYRQQIAAIEFWVWNNCAFVGVGKLFEKVRPIRHHCVTVYVPLFFKPVEPVSILLIALNPDSRLVAARQSLQAADGDPFLAAQPFYIHNQQMARRRL